MGKDIALIFFILFVVIDDQGVIELVLVQGTVFLEEFEAFHVFQKDTIDAFGYVDLDFFFHKDASIP